MRKSTVLGLILACLASAPLAYAGPDWVEIGDAGSLPGSAQTVMGIGPFSRINGSLSGAGFVGADFEDMFVIRITDPQTFSATTSISGGGSAEFDTQLWLFTVEVPKFVEDGLGIIGNDDCPSFAKCSDVGASLIALPPTDMSDPPPVIADNLYYLAITGSNNDPLSDGGPIFFQAEPDEISGPDGQGGSIPIFGWTGPPTGFGDYSIRVTGAAFAATPEPASLAVLVALGALALRRRSGTRTRQSR